MTDDGAAAAAFERAVRVLAAPPAWLRAAVDGEAVLASVRGDAGAVDGVGEGEVVACEPLDVRLTGDGWRGWYALTVRDAAGMTRRIEVSGCLTPPVGAIPAATAGRDLSTSPVVHVRPVAPAVTSLRSAC